MSRKESLKKGAMIRAFAMRGSVAEAADIAKINRRSHSRWLKNDADYREKFEDAKAMYISRLESECDRRAVKGIPRQLFYKGQPIVIPCKRNDPGAIEVTREDGTKIWGVPYVEREYSDLLLMFRLKRLDPRYRDHVTVRAKVKHADYVGPPPKAGALLAAFKERLL